MMMPDHARWLDGATPRTEWFQGSSSGISIFGNEAFRAIIKAALYTLLGIPTGRRLLAAIRKLRAPRGFEVRIVPKVGDSGHMAALGGMAETNGLVHFTRAYMRDQAKGRGSSGLVTIDPDAQAIVEPDGTWHFLPLPATLAHELIHVLHGMRGELGESLVAAYNVKRPTDKRLAPNREEARTLGVGRFKVEPISENRIREELGVFKRKNYYDY